MSKSKAFVSKAKTRAKGENGEKPPGCIIAVANMKGGVGKTTIAQTVAMYFMENTERKLVTLVDADPQGTSFVWADVAESAGHPYPRISGLGGPAVMLRELEQMRAERDIVVIDCPPRLGPATRAAMMAADIILMPITPGVADLWALQDTLAELEQALVTNPDVIRRAVMNRTDRTGMARDIEASLRKMNVEVLDTRLGARVAFSEAMAAGQSVLTYEARAPEASVEAHRLGREIGKLVALALGEVAA